MQNKIRYEKIDLLRGFSILLVILTHVSVYYLNQPVLFIIWNYIHFAVPLFVFCSGFVLYRKYKHLSSKSEIITFVKNRFSRLLVPYYIFLLFYFLVNLIEKKTLSLNNIFGSIILLNGPDISWLVILFLELAIVYPLLIAKDYSSSDDLRSREASENCSRQARTIMKHLTKIPILVLAFLLSFLAALFLDFQKINIDYRLIMFIPWLLPFLLAKYYHKLESSKKIRFLALGIFIILFILQRWFVKPIVDNPVLQYNKYPPNFYYLSYGIAWIFLLDLFFDLSIFQKPLVKKFFKFFSVNSYALYFTHYIIIQVVQYFFKINFSFIALFTFVLLGSVFITLFFQSRFLKSLWR